MLAVVIRLRIQKNAVRITSYSGGMVPEGMVPQCPPLFRHKRLQPLPLVTDLFSERSPNRRDACCMWMRWVRTYTISTLAAIKAFDFGARPYKPPHKCNGKASGKSSSKIQSPLRPRSERCRSAKVWTKPSRP